jgi:hypothetical protein
MKVLKYESFLETMQFAALTNAQRLAKEEELRKKKKEEESKSASDKKSAADGEEVVKSHRADVDMEEVEGEEGEEMQDEGEDGEEMQDEGE